MYQKRVLPAVNRIVLHWNSANVEMLKMWKYLRKFFKQENDSSLFYGKSTLRLSLII